MTEAAVRPSFFKEKKPKTRQIMLRMTEEEHAWLENAADNAGMAAVDVVRLAVETLMQGIEAGATLEGVREDGILAVLRRGRKS